MLDFRVDTFLAVCRCMSFTRAAAALHITQPAVSQHIRALEAQYGVRFFSFEGKKLTLTDAGRLFLRTATTMRHDAQHLRDALGSLSGGGRRLVFGATLTIGEYVMPAPLARLLAAEPNVSLRMVVANTAELLRGLDRGDIDFAIVEGFFEKSEYDSLSYLTERYVAVCAPGYRFRQPVHTLEDLLGERLLTREPGSGTREILERRLREHNLTVRDFRAVTEIGSLNAIKALVRMVRASRSCMSRPSAPSWKAARCVRSRCPVFRSCTISPSSGGKAACSRKRTARSSTCCAPRPTEKGRKPEASSL